METQNTLRNKSYNEKNIWLMQSIFNSYQMQIYTETVAAVFIS